MLRGYIDESGNGTIFTLSSIITTGENWESIEDAWKKVLADTNRNLLAQGRPVIRRYHAAECSSRIGDFEGWSTDEQIAFFNAVLPILCRYPMDMISYSVNLQELVGEMPFTSPCPDGFAYVYLLWWMMLDFSQGVLVRNPSELLMLAHDHCKYNAALREAFDLLIADENFRYRERFVNLTPETWQNCIPLQPADVIAYENFKEAERQTVPGRSRRKSLKLIIADGRIGGESLYFNRDNLRDLNSLFANTDEAVRDILLITARVKKKTTM